MIPAVPSTTVTRRAALGTVASLALVAAAPGVLAQGAAWPGRPVRVVVPYAAGGPTDAVARTVGAKLSVLWGQPVVIDNKPGANANLGAGEVARAPGDGYTLLVGTGSTHGINPAIYPKLPFDPVKDFVPVVQLTDSVLYIAVPTDLPVKDLKELVAYSKANPGKVNYASVGVGSPHHLAGEMLKLRTGADITHVPYKGSGPARQAMLAGEVQVLFDSAALPLAQAGKVRILAVTSARRWPAAPDIPTAVEQGLDGFVVSGWYALFAPAGTPAAVVQKINADVNMVLADPDVQARARGLSVVMQGGSVRDLEQLVASELARWPAVVKASGAKFE